MNIIALEGIEFYAYHGYYPEERIIGGKFLVDIYVETDFSKAASADELSKTLNYESLYAIAKREMDIPSKLLENVVDRIIASINKQFIGLLGIRVRLSKLNPPLGGKVERTFVEVYFSNN